jgi:hypothetical protein
MTYPVGLHTSKFWFHCEVMQDFVQSAVALAMFGFERER